ncbi:tetratricopeptide-like helical domain-containing protein (TPR) [Tieghemostelium lacteum]|uniref:Tetratricopeptide-like helical domain-containing protein (TPR) n=1 Tax=Tieghemostelium lacteum TaxID=361077 RepID=A0A152A4I8_TIELA|nr:tetratricopeptide-like helical domain-containing protein (TPR) [Tieghemostelium lacteum]|eukprot:KYR01134.1 tetratricopeptide-like helical domain-containing protein (TPR) [Tieghemostelium lacteum]
MNHIILQYNCVLAFKNQKYEESLKYLDQLITFNENDVIALCNRATCNFKLGLYRQSISDCDRVLELEPFNSIAIMRKLKSIKHLKDYHQDYLELKKSVSDLWGYFNVKLYDNTIMDMSSDSDDEEEDSIKSQYSKSDKKVSISLSNSSSSVPIPLQQSLGQQSQVHQTSENESIMSLKKSSSFDELNQLLEQLSTDSLAIEINKGNMLVNSGNIVEAFGIFSDLIESHPLIPSAYLGRGTCNAFLGNLDDAIQDFNRSIELDNTCADAYKRRGQSKVAKQLEKEALEDFNQAVVFDKSPNKDYDILYQRGLLHFQMHNYERAERDFKRVVEMQPLHKLAWNRIGLCLNAKGRPIDALVAFQRSIDIDPLFEASYTNVGQCWKDIGNYQESLKSFSKAIEIAPGYANALHLRGLLFFNSGKLELAIQDWSKCIEQDQKEGQMKPEVKQLRAIALYTCGKFSKSLKDYQEILEWNSDHYSFYQRELAMFTRYHLDRSIKEFNIDQSVDCYLKTYQCQRFPPSSLMEESGYRVYKDELMDQKIEDIENDVVFNRESDILKVAVEFGSMLQYQCSGFLPNYRQKLQCGLAIIEMAQTLREFWKSGGVMEVDGRSSSGQTTPHQFQWRDLYDIGVKWRQLSEPNDPVWWIDLLSPKQFQEGFGSHTPMITGQCQVVRYYPMFERSFELMKKLIPNTHPSYQDVQKARNCREMHSIMKDFFVVIPCYSMFNSSKVMEGTRLTLQYVQPEGYEFAIRTPGTPQRWEEYSEEMTLIFNQLTQVIQQSDHFNSTNNNKKLDDKSLDRISELILSLTYYWYNFMPLSRGSAAIGLTTMLALFLSVDIRISSPIPKDIQPDWEGILRQTPESFLSVIKPWVFPSRVTYSLDCENLPSISNEFNTIRKIIQILNKVSL